MTADLRTRYLGLDLTGPLIASASPLTGRIDHLCALEDAGVSAVVLPSLFEEELIDEAFVLNDRLEVTTDFYAESIDIFPDQPGLLLGPERHLRLLSQAKQRLAVAVIASLNAVHLGSWQGYAGEMVDAGADAIELNLYSMATDPARDAAAVETGLLEVIAQVRAAVS